MDERNGSGAQLPELEDILAVPADGAPEINVAGSGKKKKKKNKSNPDEEPVEFSLAGSLIEIASVFVAALTAIAIIFVFIARPVGVRGSSMEPTLHENDWLLVTPVYGEPEYGDIIISYPPTVFNEPLVKRVIAVGGQTVDIDYNLGVVYVDGYALDESRYILEPISRHLGNEMDFPVTVPYGYVFMMGDNRNGSTDSRSLDVGFCREEYILGKAICRIIPFGSWDVNGSFRNVSHAN